MATPAATVHKKKKKFNAGGEINLRRFSLWNPLLFMQQFGACVKHPKVHPKVSLQFTRQYHFDTH
jgi:hypothetical protein